MGLENFNWHFYFTYYFTDFYKYFKDTEQWFAHYLCATEGILACECMKSTRMSRLYFIHSQCFIT